MPHSRPYILPFSKAGRIGLPWHGLVRDGQLQLATGTRAYGASSGTWSSATVAVRHPEAAIATGFTVADDPQEDQTHRWQNYALLSGGDRYIGGDDLGANHWLYCDANRTWIVYWSITGNSTSATLSVYLKQLFGVFGDGVETMAAPRLLASLTFAAQDYAGNAVTSLAVVPFASHSLDGAKTVFNITSSGSTAATKWPYSYFTQYDKGVFVANRYVHDILTCTISGNGSTAAGTVGNGISASIVRTQAGPDLRLSHTGDALSYDESFSYLGHAAMQHDGTLTQVQIDYARTLVISDDGDDGTGHTAQQNDSTTSLSISFAGVTLTNSSTGLFLLSSYLGQWIYGKVACNGAEYEDATPPVTYSGQAGITDTWSLYATSTSLDIAVLRVDAAFLDMHVIQTSAVGKQGDEQEIASFSPGDNDVTYDSVRGQITVGEVGERVVYV